MLTTYRLCCPLCLPVPEPPTSSPRRASTRIGSIAPTCCDAVTARTASSRTRRLGNLSHLPDALIEIIRRALQGETLRAAGASASRSRVRARTVTCRPSRWRLQRLGLASLLAAKPSPRARPGAGDGGRAHRRPAHQAGHHALVAHHDAGRGLRRGRGERGRSVRGDGLAARAPGHDPEEARRAPSERRRPGALRPVVELLRGHQPVRWPSSATTATARSGLLQVNYGLLTDARGCPVAVSVHEGNVADSQTLMPEVKRLREDFGIEQLVMVGDRGMISNKAIDEMRETDGIDWITALEERVDPRAGRARATATRSVRRAQSARAELAGLSGRAAGGVPQSAARQAARAQARGAARGHRAQPRQDQGPGGCGQARRRATRSACAWARSSTSTRSPSTSS